MNGEEYVIININPIEKKIEEWESELLECFKAPIGKFNSDYVSTLQQAIATARELLSLSIPLIPEIEKAFDEGAVSYCHSSASLREFMNFGEEKQKYISNLKLDV